MLSPFPINSDPHDFLLMKHKISVCICAAANCAGIALMVFSIHGCDVLWTPPQCPEIYSFSPNGARHDSILTILGAHFETDRPDLMEVKIGETAIPYSNIEVPNSGTMLITLPKLSRGGKISIAHHSLPECQASSAEDFIYEYTVGSIEFISAAGINGFLHPAGMDINADGTSLIVADQDHNQIKEVQVLKAGFPITRIAGNQYGDSGDPDYSDNALFSNLNAPTDVVYDTNGNIYVADASNLCIRKIAFGQQSNPIYTLTSQTAHTDNCPTPVSSAYFESLSSIEISSDNSELFVSDANGYRIRFIENDQVCDYVDPGTMGNPKGLSYSTARSPAYSLIAASPDNGKGVYGIMPNHRLESIHENGDGMLKQAYDLDLDAEGNIFLTDTGIKKVLVIYKNGSVDSLTTHGGNPQYSFGIPEGIAVDRTRHIIYVSDKLKNLILVLHLE